MYDFFTSPTSNIPTQPHPTPAMAQTDLHAPRMERTASSSSTSSNASSSSISFCRPGSSSASLSSSYWSDPSTSSTSSPSTSYLTASGSTSRPSHHRHFSNGTSYLPTPYRSSLLHSSSATSPSPRPQAQTHTSSYISDDDLLALDFEPLPPPSAAPLLNTHMTTEEQVAAVREQVDRERMHWAAGPRPQLQAGMGYGPERKKTLRFAPEAQGRRGAQAGAGRRRFLAPSASVGVRR